MNRLRAIRAGFALAVAFCAATIGDALMEGVSNSGLLWRGHYTDNSSADLLPMGAISVVAFAVTLALIMACRLRRLRAPMRALCYSTSRALPVRAVAAMLPAIFGLQLLTLLAMETVEQVAVYGHAVGGTLWLGGPVAISLLAHLLIAVAMAFGGASLVTGFAEQVVRVVCALGMRVLHAPPRLAAASLRARPVCAADRLFRSARLAQRGPPAPAVFASP